NLRPPRALPFAQPVTHCVLLRRVHGTPPSAVAVRGEPYAPAQKWPVEPEMIGGGREIDRDQDGVDDCVDREVDEKRAILKNNANGLLPHGGAGDGLGAACSRRRSRASSSSM